MKTDVPRTFVCPSCNFKERYLADEWLITCSRCGYTNPDYINEDEEEEDDEEVEPTG